MMCNSMKHEKSDGVPKILGATVYVPAVRFLPVLLDYYIFLGRHENSPYHL